LRTAICEASICQARAESASRRLFFGISPGSSSAVFASPFFTGDTLFEVDAVAMFVVAEGRGGSEEECRKQTGRSLRNEPLERVIEGVARGGGGRSERREVRGEELLPEERLGGPAEAEDRGAEELLLLRRRRGEQSQQRLLVRHSTRLSLRRWKEKEGKWRDTTRRWRTSEKGRARGKDEAR